MRKLFACMAILLFTAFSAQAAITVEDFGSGGAVSVPVTNIVDTGTNFVTNITFIGTLSNVTVGATSDGCLVVAVGWEANQNHGISNMTFNGVELIKAEESLVGVPTSVRQGASIWYLANPDATTANIEWRWNANTTPFAPFVTAYYVLSGVDQVSPLEDGVTNGSVLSATSISGTVTSPEAGCVAIDVFCSQNAAALASLGAGQVLNVSAEPGGGAQAISSFEVVGSGAQVQSVTIAAARPRLSYAVALFDAASGPGVVVRQQDVTLDENGGTANYLVSLNAAPSANVIVSNVSDDVTQVTVSPATLTFTPGNFATPQAVTITGVDDLDIGTEEGSVTVSIAPGSAAEYASVPDVTVRATLLSEDLPPAFDASDTVAVPEGETNEFTVVLLAPPSGGNVVITNVNVNPSVIDVEPTFLTFTAANWSNAQEVSVISFEDIIGGNLSATVDVSVVTSLSAPNYQDVTNSQEVLVTVLDNEASLTVAPQSLKLSETGNGTFDVELFVQPTGNVDVSVDSGDLSIATVTPATLSFTTANWSNAQQVTVSAVPDAVGGNRTAIITVGVSASADPNFLNAPDETVEVLVIDDDGPLPSDQVTLIDSGDAIAGTGNVGVGGQGPYSFNVSSLGVAGDYLVVGAAHETARPTGMTFNGDPMELLFVTSIGGTAWIEYWGIATGSTTGTVETSYSSNIFGSQHFIYAFLGGVDTEDPVRATGEARFDTGVGFITNVYSAPAVSGDAAFAGVNKNNSFYTFEIEPSDVIFVSNTGDGIKSSYGDALAIDAELPGGAYTNYITVLENDAVDGNREVVGGIIIRKFTPKDPLITGISKVGSSVIVEVSNVVANSTNMLQGSTDLVVGGWSDILSSSVIATADTVALTATVSGASLQAYRVEMATTEPGLILSENFESGAAGWSIVTSNGTAWQINAPSAVSANSGAICAFNESYVDDTIAYLRSKVIDLTGVTSADLIFSQAVSLDTDGLANNGLFDVGIVRVIDTNGTQLVKLSETDAINQLTWTAVTNTLSGAAVGLPVMIEWELSADDFDGGSQVGWFVDDVKIIEN